MEQQHHHGKMSLHKFDKILGPRVNDKLVWFTFSPESITPHISLLISNHLQNSPFSNQSSATHALFGSQPFIHINQSIIPECYIHEKRKKEKEINWRYQQINCPSCHKKSEILHPGTKKEKLVVFIQ